MNKVLKITLSLLAIHLSFLSFASFIMWENLFIVLPSELTVNGRLFYLFTMSISYLFFSKFVFGKGFEYEV